MDAAQVTELVKEAFPDCQVEAQVDGSQSISWILSQFKS